MRNRNDFLEVAAYVSAIIVAVLAIADWFIKVFSVKHKVVEAAFRVADTALDLSGGFGMFKKSELERLFRDARAGKFHPANPLLTHEIVGKISLGISPDEQPRWG